METDLNQIRNKLIDRVYLGLIIFIIPVLSASLFRITKTGWDWIYAVQIILAITANLVYVFRSKIVLNVKTHFFCILFIIISFTGALKFGIAGAYIFCILSVIIATLIFGKRTGYIYLIISLSGLSIIGFLYGNKKIQTLVNLQTYNTNGLTWIILVASLFWLLGIVLFAINLFNTYFEKNIYALIQKSKEQEIAQQKIIENEEKYHSLVDHAGDPILLINKDSNFIEVNKRAGQLLGYTQDEFFNMKVSDLYSPEELKINPIPWQLIHENKTFITERKWKKKDGSEVEVELNIKVLAGDNYLVIGRDITERKKAEKLLNEYKHFFYNNKDLSCIANLDGYFEIINPQFSKLLGYSEKELLENQFLSFIHPDDIDATIKEVEKLKAGIIMISFINRCKKKNGDYLWFEWDVTSDNTSGKLYGIARDITERKITEEQLVKSEQKYRSLVEQASDPIMITDFEGNFIDVNTSLCNTYGYTKDELLKLNINTLIEPEQLKERPVQFDQLALGNKLLTDRRMIKKDGSIIEVEANVKKIDENHIMAIARDITERKRLEAELIVHKEQLRLFIEHSPASLAMLDTDMRYIATSRRWLNDYNLGDMELIGKTHYEVFPEITQEWKDIHQRCLKGAIEKNEEDSFTRLDGRTDWLRWEIRPWHKSTGEIGGIIMFTEVITDRILANQKLVASEQIRRHIMNSALDAIVCMDINGGITLWTPQAEKIFGWNETDIIGKQMSDVIIPHNYRKAHEMGLSNYLQTGSGNVLNKTIEITALNKSGREFPIELSIVHVLNGESEFFCAFIRDITERKKIEKSLKDSEEKHRALIENIHDTIILVNKNTEVIYQSPSFVRTAGYELGELKTTSAFEFVHPDDLQNSQNLFKEAFLSPGISLPLQYRIRHKSGEYIWIEGNVTNLLDNESVKAFIVIYRNITERKKDEAELIRYNAELKKTNTELDRFVYSTSHDLRAPLKSMLGLINIAKEDVPPGNDMQIERLSMLNKSVVKLDNFIEDILHYSRNKGMKLATDEINFKEIIDGILEGNKFIEGINTIDFQVKINTDTKFLSDAERLKVILNNVITNAIKYRDHAKENSFVKIDVQCNDKKAIITIEDNGIGIAGKDHEKVFEMFYRATILSSGSGLGLYIVKETLEKLGGKIKLESKLNAGTKVIFEIPNQFISLN